MRVNGVPYRTVWMDGAIGKMSDQRRLPFSFEVLALSTVQETAEAIRHRAVQGVCRVPPLKIAKWTFTGASEY